MSLYSSILRLLGTAAIAIATIAPALAFDNGNNVSIEYQAPDGSKRVATMTSTDVNSPIKGLGVAYSTRDAEWLVTNPDGQRVQVQWILFRATDGSTRKMRIASQYGATPADPNDDNSAMIEHIDSDLVYAYPDGKDEHRVSAVWLVAPDGRKYVVSVRRLYRPFNRPPMFHVSQLQ